MTMTMKKNKKNIPFYKVKEMAAAGLKTTEIAAAVGCSQSTVSKKLKKEGIRPARGVGRRGAGVDKSKMLAVAQSVFFDPGAAPAEIAKDTDLAISTTIYYLKKMEELRRALALAGYNTNEKFLDLGDVKIVFDDNTSIIPRAIFRRWITCTWGAAGIGRSVLNGKYYRAMIYLTKLLRRFLTADDRFSMTMTMIEPGDILHPAPGLAGQKRIFTKNGAEIAARAQARQHRAGEAVSPGPEVLGAYHILSTQKPSEQRDVIIRDLLAKTKYLVISTDFKVEDVIYSRKIAISKDRANELDTEYRFAIGQAKRDAFVTGKKALRRLINKYVLSYIGWAWFFLGCPDIPGVDPHIARQRIEGDIIAARDFAANLNYN